MGADLLFSNVRVNVEGDDAVGYRVQLRAAGETQSFYVVKEDGAYRILTVAPMAGPLALMALERIEADDFAGARRWLDWARLDLRGGKLRGSRWKDRHSHAPGPWAWRRTCARARLATALLLADCAMGERALPLLLAARGATDDATDRLSLDIALAKAYLELEPLARTAGSRQPAGDGGADLGAGIPLPAMGRHPAAAMGCGGAGVARAAGAPAGRFHRARDAGASRRGARPVRRDPA